ncbi:MAG: hypothetical protein ACKVRN_05345 [Pyrinomonadaceae bacterium]
MFAIIRAKSLLEAMPQIRALEATTCVQHIVTVLSLDAGLSLKQINLKNCSIETIVLREFGWSKSLNVGIKALSSGRSEDNFVLIVSTTVCVETYDVQSMMNSAQMQNASCSFALFEGREEPSYLLPRNTYIVWKKSVLERLGTFDETLDESTGMEDYEMVLRAYKELQKVPYLGSRSVKVKIPDSVTFERKLDRERKGIALIEERYNKPLVESLHHHLAQQRSLKNGNPTR